MSDFDESWFYRFVYNIFAYLLIILPGYAVISYFKNKKNDLAVSGDSLYSNFITLCIFGNPIQPYLPVNESSDMNTRFSRNSSLAQQTIRLMVCSFGLFVSYLTWGLIQEYIMTQKYANLDDQAFFTDSQFLVFANRVFAFLLAVCVVTFRKRSCQNAPIYKYSYCSLSNIISSWFQYEALKFVSFPTQVLCKASKVIPVMLMGKLVSRNKYECYEYLVAALICVGMVLFLLGSTEEHSKTTVTTFSGVCTLLGYLLFDSFSSNWQSALYRQYNVSSMQMMCWVNMFSCLFTVVSLLLQHRLVYGISFMFSYPLFSWHCLVLSICSAIGQMFIYYTISQFGAIIFTIIMILRQAISILLSCIVYRHNITYSGLLGLCVVFSAVLLKVYAATRLRQR